LKFGGFCCLLLSAETAEETTRAAEAGAKNGEQEHSHSHAQTHPHPHHKLAVHVEWVLPVAVLYVLNTLAVHQTSFLWKHVGERLFNIIHSIALHQSGKNADD